MGTWTVRGTILLRPSVMTLFGMQAEPLSETKSLAPYLYLSTAHHTFRFRTYSSRTRNKKGALEF